MVEKLRRGLIFVVMIFCLSGISLNITALAAPGNKGNNGNKGNSGNTGTGQTQVHIHGVGGIGKNKAEVVIIVDGKEYIGTIQGSKLTIEMDSTDNGFDFAKGESMDVEYYVVGGGNGIITLTHKEGNGNNIGKEHDKGLNNFNGNVKQNDPAEQSEDPTKSSEEPTKPSEEPTEPSNPADPTQPGYEIDPQNETEPDDSDKPTFPSHPTVGPFFPPFIWDKDVPKAEVPKTGDISMVLAAVSLTSGAGLALLNRKNKEKDEEG